MKIYHKIISGFVILALSVLIIIISLLISSLALLIIGDLYGFIGILLLNIILINYYRKRRPKENDQVPVQSQVIEGRNIFLSYSTKDTDHFKIQEVARLLQKSDGIDKVYHWESNSGQNIVEYMEQTLNKTDVFILFCSENSKRSV